MSCVAMLGTTGVAVLDSQFIPFVLRCYERSVHKNCVLWGSRVIVSGSARKEVLAMLHDAHPGIVHMKGFSRSYVLWPGMDRDIEVCQGMWDLSDVMSCTC